MNMTIMVNVIDSRLRLDSNHQRQRYNLSSGRLAMAAPWRLVLEAEQFAPVRMNLFKKKWNGGWNPFLGALRPWPISLRFTKSSGSSKFTWHQSKQKQQQQKQQQPPPPYPPQTRNYFFPTDSSRNALSLSLMGATIHDRFPSFRYKNPKQKSNQIKKTMSY